MKLVAVITPESLTQLANSVRKFCDDHEVVVDDVTINHQVDDLYEIKLKLEGDIGVSYSSLGDLVERYSPEHVGIHTASDARIYVGMYRVPFDALADEVEVRT